MLYTTKRLKIYIAGPYSAPDARLIQQNVDLAVAIGIKILKLGHYPYIPHLTHYIAIHKDSEWNCLSSEWYKFDNPWLEVCNALYFVRPSNGATAELKLAKKLNKAIFYSLNDIPRFSG